MNERNKNRVTVLDVEDDEGRQARIKSILENLNSSASATRPSTLGPLFGSAQHHPHPEQPTFGLDIGDRTTFSVEPPIELLSRVRAFLPQIQASNAVLEKQMEADPSTVDIEHISEGMDQYIEMNLGLGLFEDRSKRTHSDSDEDTEMSTSSSSESSSSASSSDREAMFHRSKAFTYEEDYDSDESSEAEIITSFVPWRPVRPLPRRATNSNASSTSPKIVVVGEEDKSGSSA